MFTVNLGISSTVCYDCYSQIKHYNKTVTWTKARNNHRFNIRACVCYMALFLWYTAILEIFSYNRKNWVMFICMCFIDVKRMCFHVCFFFVWAVSHIVSSGVSVEIAETMRQYLHLMLVVYARGEKNKVERKRILGNGGCLDCYFCGPMENPLKKDFRIRLYMFFIMWIFK